MDLFIWTRESGYSALLLSFQKGGSDYSVSWREGAGLRCNRLDSGKDSVYKNRTPMIAEAIELDLNLVARHFATLSADLPLDIREFVLGKLRG